jgi:hypothetical protein
MGAQADGSNTGVYRSTQEYTRQGIDTHNLIATAGLHAMLRLRGHHS